jgi:hypothetical protein
MCRAARVDSVHRTILRRLSARTMPRTSSVFSSPTTISLVTAIGSCCSTA